MLAVDRGHRHASLGGPRGARCRRGGRCDAGVPRVRHALPGVHASGGAEHAAGGRTSVSGCGAAMGPAWSSGLPGARASAAGLAPRAAAGTSVHRRRRRSRDSSGRPLLTNFVRDLADYAEQYGSLPFEQHQARMRRRHVLAMLERHDARRILEVGGGPDPIFTSLDAFDQFVVVELAERRCGLDGREEGSEGRVQYGSTTIDASNDASNEGVIGRPCAARSRSDWTKPPRAGATARVRSFPRDAAYYHG